MRRKLDTFTDCTGTIMLFTFVEVYIIPHNQYSCTLIANHNSESSLAGCVPLHVCIIMLMSITLLCCPRL